MRTPALALTIIWATFTITACKETDDNLRWSRQISRASNQGPLTDWIPLPSSNAPQRTNNGRVLTYPQPPGQVTQFFPEPPYALIGEPFLLRPPQQQYQKIVQQQPEEHVQLLYVPLEHIRQRSKYPNFTPPSPRAVNDFYLSSTPAPQTTTLKPKQKPHQPPLAMFMSKHTDTSNPLNEILSLLQNAKTIDVLDNISSKKPNVFVGPSALKVPSDYVRFDLPYLSNIEHNRVERRIDNVPFFVAPLSYKAPQGYSKIPFPSPHVGSVVVRPIPIESTTTPKPRLYQNDFVPLSHAAYVTQLAQSELGATERYNIGKHSTEKPTKYYDNVQAQKFPAPTFQTQFEEEPSEVATRTQLDDAYPVHSTLKPPFESFKQTPAKTTTEKPYSPLEHFKNLYSTVQSQRSTATPYDVHHSSKSYASDNNNYHLSTPVPNYNSGYSGPVAKITREQLFKEPQKNLIGSEQANDNTQQQSIQQSTSRQQFESAQDLKKYNQDKGNKQYQSFVNGPSVATYTQFGPVSQQQPTYQQQYIRQEVMPSQQPTIQQYQPHSVVFQPQETPKVQINGQDASKYEQQYVVPSSERPKLQPYQQQYVVSTTDQPKLQQQNYQQQYVPSTEQPKLQQYQQQYVVPTQQQILQQQIYEQPQQEVIPSRQPIEQYPKQYPQQQITYNNQDQPKGYEPQVTEHSIIEQYNRQYNQAFEILSRPTSGSTHKSTTEKQTTTTEPYVTEHQTSRYPEFVQYHQPSPTPRQQIRTTTHRPRHSSKHRGSQTYRDSIRQDYPDSVDDAFIEIAKEKKPQNDYYDMKHYFKQQSQFHALNPSSKTPQSAEHTTTIKYSLPPELPAISEMLPGLINSLQDATKPYEVATTPIPETTTPQYTRRTPPTRGRRPVPTRQYNRETTSRRTPVVRRRPTYQTRTSPETSSKSYNRHQSRYNGNNNNNNDDITTESQRKSSYRQNYRTRTRPQVSKHREEEEEKPNYPDPLPVKVTAATIVSTEDILKNTEPLYKNPETRVEEYSAEDIVATTEFAPIEHQQYSSPAYESVSKSDASVMIVTPSTVDAVKYTPQFDVSVNSEEVVVNTSPSVESSEEENAATEVYGFTREPNFPPVVDDSQQQSEEVVEDIRPVYTKENIFPTTTRRTNFLKRTSRLSTTTAPSVHEVTTEYADNNRYTIKPYRKQYTTTPVPRIVKIRGRIRKPSTTTTEKVDNEVIDASPKPIIHRFISRARTTATQDETTESSKGSFRITVDPDDQNNYESVRRSHYVNLDTAESQWSGKVNSNSFQPVVKPTKSDDISKLNPKGEEVEIITAGDVDTFMFTVTPETPKATSTSEMSFMELLKDVAEELSNTKNDTVSAEEEQTPKPIRKRGYWRRIRVKPAQEEAFVASESQNVQNTYLNSLQDPEKINSKTEQKYFDSSLSYTTTEKATQTTTALPDTTPVPVQQESTVLPDVINESTVLSIENIDKSTEASRLDVADSLETEMSTTGTPLIQRIEEILHVINLDKVGNLENLDSVTSQENETTESVAAPVTESDPIGSAVVVTSTSTVITHETEICYRGRCVKNPKSQKNN